jgi:hypothetical protein
LSGGDGGEPPDNSDEIGVGWHLKPSDGIARIFGMEGDALDDALEVFAWRTSDSFGWCL